MIVALDDATNFRVAGVPLLLLPPIAWRPGAACYTNNVMARRAMPIPTDITEDRDARELRITWSDGHQSRYSYRRLRQACPCAMCVHEWTGERLLDPKRVPPDVHPKEVARVGAYALRFTWSDGHMTGIYTFPLLRNVCECDLCEAARARAAASEGAR